MERNDSVVGSIAGFITGVAGRIIVISLLVLAVYLSVSRSFAFGHAIFYQHPVEEAPGRDMEIRITEETDMDGLASALYTEGLISNELAFRIQGRLYKVRLHPGSYVLNTSMTTKEILSSFNMSEAEYQDKTNNENAAAIDAGGVVGGGSDGV